MKAIHNSISSFIVSNTLFSILQRYSFESNSQRFRVYNLSRCVVFYLTKILIWKQFTTRLQRLRHLNWLFSILQRYSFESNSQQFILRYVGVSVVFYLTKILIWKQFTTLCRHCVATVCCFLSYKDTHLKAIHNSNIVSHITFLLFSILQRYSFESNSQPSKEFNQISKVVFYLTKILIWKQFTTR